MEKFEHEYKADQIQVLEGLEAVRKKTIVCILVVYYHLLEDYTT